MWKVYGLVDPRDGEIRYVGLSKTRYLSKRLGQHVREARLSHVAGHKTRKSQWMREVFAVDLRPTILLLQTCFTEDEGLLVEKDWIARLRPKLVNESSGGRGLNDPSRELSIRLSLSSKRHWAEDDGTRRAALAEQGRRYVHLAIKASAEKRRGRPLAEDHKAAIRAHHTTPEYRQRARESKLGTRDSSKGLENKRQGQQLRRQREREAFMQLPEVERERILAGRAERARIKKRDAQRRRRATRKLN